MPQFLPFVGQFLLLRGMPRPGLDVLVAFAMTLLYLVMYVLMAVGVALLLWARASLTLLTILCGLLMLAPCVNLLVLLPANQSATHALRRAGIRVGLMGTDGEEVERIIDPELRTGYGYNLTGNVSGRCPECGRPVE
jgi:hypothetical protein